jgi:hypothetical protein
MPLNLVGAQWNCWRDLVARKPRIRCSKSATISSLGRFAAGRKSK